MKSKQFSKFSIFLIIILNTLIISLPNIHNRDYQISILMGYVLVVCVGYIVFKRLRN
jgi:hypothetical protein